jgi:hypothetical protein
MIIRIVDLERHSQSKSPKEEPLDNLEVSKKDKGADILPSAKKRGCPRGRSLMSFLRE